MNAVEGFRYRVEDVLGGVTSTMIKEARALEVKQEILRSQALKQHFQDHPKDLEVLQHDVNKSKRVKHPELKKIPDYLMPTAQDSVNIRKALVGKGGAQQKSSERVRGKRGRKKRGRKDPLLSLSMGKKAKN